MTYIIEPGLPIPPRKRIGRPSPYPFAKLKVGDSFFVPVEGSKADRLKRHKALTGAARRARKTTRHTYEIREIANGVRVWRVA